MNLIGTVFKVEKLSRVDTVKGTGLTTILSLKTVPSLFLPICGVHSRSLDFKTSLSFVSLKSLGLFAEIEFLDFLEIRLQQIKKSAPTFNTLSSFNLTSELLDDLHCSLLSEGSFLYPAIEFLYLETCSRYN